MPPTKTVPSVRPTPKAAARPRAVAPSPAFLGILTSMVIVVVAMTQGLVPVRAGLFTLMLSSWLASLCLHEFGHAYAAYRLGDRSVVDKGYLTLNPLRYADPVTSIGMPLFMLLLGGFALPGGCVYVVTSALRGRHAPAIVSAAGPAANALVILAVAAAFALGLVDADEPSRLSVALSMIAYLQVVALAFNLLPVPGLDGYGILRPYLPADIREKGDAFAGHAWLVLVGVIWFVPGASSLIWDKTTLLLDLVGIPGDLGQVAFAASLFWL